MDVDQFTESLAGLLPTGYAWPRDPGSVLMAVIRSEAAFLAQHTKDVHSMVFQWQPHATAARLAEWEESCGLPILCYGPDQSESQRRQSLLATLRGPDLPLADSSHACIDALRAACAAAGYNAEVRYNRPFRVGRNRVGQRLGALNGHLHVLVTGAQVPLRVGYGRVGDRLIQRDLPTANLLCVLDRIVPARFSINITFLA